MAEGARPLELRLEAREPGLGELPHHPPRERVPGEALKAELQLCSNKWQLRNQGLTMRK